MRTLDRPFGTERSFASKEPAFTITAWIKGHGTVLKLLGASKPGQVVVFQVDNNGKPTADFGFSLDDNHDSRLHTDTNIWTHVAFVYDGFGTRSIVVTGEEEVDVYQNTTLDFFEEANFVLSNPVQHNVVRQRKNELGDIVGAYAGFSKRDCFEKALNYSHRFFTVQGGLCKTAQDTDSQTGGFVYKTTVQYRITEASFRNLTIGPITGQIDEVMIFSGRLLKETVHQIGLSQNIGTRFDGSSVILQTSNGRGRATKKIWEAYPDFTEDQKLRAECGTSLDERYHLALDGHPTYSYSGEGRGLAEKLQYEPYAGTLENITYLTVEGDSCSWYNLDNALTIHNRVENTSYADCSAQRNKNGVCRSATGELQESEEADCTATFLPFTNFTWLPAEYALEYNVKEEDCQQTTEVWGYSEPLVIGEQGENQQVFNDHELTFYYKNKVGGEQMPINFTSLHSVKEWCRNHISCVGIQQDAEAYFPVEKIVEPSANRSGYQICSTPHQVRVSEALECFLIAAKEIGPANLLYVHGDEFRSHAWGYSGHTNGTVCFKRSNETFNWALETIVSSSPVLCSDNPQQYYTLPIYQSRWQRNNDTTVNRKDAQCVQHRLDWIPYDYTYRTIGTSSEPHFLIKEQKAWQAEPVNCLYTSNSSFQLNISSLRECRDTAIYFNAIGYSFQKIGYEYIYITPRHFAHVEDARGHCQRLNEEGSNNWDLCSSQQFDCAVDNQICLNSDSPEDQFYAPAACCMDSGMRHCVITTDTTVCEPRHSFESYFFSHCTNEIVNNQLVNTSFNVYDPVYNRSEWRKETIGRLYDASYYDIVGLNETSDQCKRGHHLTMEECTAKRTEYSSHTWLGEIYSPYKVAGCAVTATQMYYNRYKFESAKRAGVEEMQFCRVYFEHFETILRHLAPSRLNMNPFRAI